MATNLVQNPGFAFSNTYLFPGYANQPYDWTANPPLPANFDGFYNSDGIGATPFLSGDDTQFWDNGTVPGQGTSGDIAFIQGNDSSPPSASPGIAASLSQTLNGLQIGATYQFSMYVNERDYPGTPPGGSPVYVTVSVGGQTIIGPDPISPAGPYLSTNPFQQIEATFTATSSSEVLTLSDVNDESALFADPSVVETQPPPTADNFNIMDSTTGKTISVPGTLYNGPVAGLNDELIYPTTDQVTITAEIPDVFIQLGQQGGSNPTIGGINVSAANGNNILDSYANSSFLTDGSGTDQNYIDTRDATANQWSTVVNFKSGDNVTMWGVTKDDFKLNWIGTQGAAGYTGITGVFTRNAGGSEAAFTLAGYTSTNQVSVSYDTINGTPYASIHAI